MYSSHLDISDHVRKGAIALLQARLSDALDLEAQLKQAHWNVKGRDFQQLHELFDKVHDEIEEFVDLLAERITTLGGVADGRVQTTAKNSSLYEYALETKSGEQHLKAVAAVLAQFAKAVRADINAAAELGEADAADIFTEISRATDKLLWFVEAHLA
ncbi:MAG: DNA starvation/stationary phase protection protein Dps [Alphaproteobacteria bacterium]|nr:MAG: DNA starvation/stationary phase protection protein Dps [Alphaproteobacteria bacterium]